MKILITSGSYGADNGRGGVNVIDRGQTCEVSDGEAKRLIALGVAKAATKTPAAAAETPAPAPASDGPGGNTPDDGKPATAQETGKNGGGYAAMKAQDLRNLMKERGLPCKVGIKNADMIAMLEAYDKEHSADATPENGSDGAADGDNDGGGDPGTDEEVNDGEQPPDLGAGDPIV